MEVNSVSSLSNEKQSSEHSTSTNVEHTSTNVEHMNTEKEKSTSVFVNHGESLALVMNASNFSKSVPFLLEVNSVSSLSNEKQSSEHSTSTNVEHTSTNVEHMNTEKEKSTSVFVNHAAIAWHESRRKWIGDQSRQPQRTTKDPIIGWSKTYEDLLSTHEPFSEPIPLSEMVDFLVDIWLDEGLFD